MMNVILLLFVAIMLFFDYKRTGSKYKLLLYIPVGVGLLLLSPMVYSIPAGFIWLARWAVIISFVLFIFFAYKDMKNKK